MSGGTLVRVPASLDVGERGTMTQAGHCVEWVRETCPDCVGGGSMVVGRGVYGDKPMAARDVLRPCSTCGGSGHMIRVALAD